MLASFYENGKFYIGKVGFVSYIAAYFSKHGRYIKLKNIRGLEEYTYYFHNKYVLYDINKLHFYH